MVCQANNRIDAAVQIVAATPRGEIIGSDVLQSTAYLLELAEVGYGFPFGCEYCSPFCEELDLATQKAKALRELDIEFNTNEWGTTRATYKTTIPYNGDGGKNDYYQIIVAKAIECNAKQLELATTASYYHSIQLDDPWGRIKRLKAYDRSNGTLEKSKKLYEELRAMPALANLPEIPKNPVFTKLAA